jgi:hypothetical protein
MMAKSRAKYFQEYNKKSKVKSIRMNEELEEKINDVVLQQDSSFNKVVLQLIEKSLNPIQKENSCHTTILQQFYKFFEKNIENLDFDENDIKLIEEVEAIINEFK